MWLPVPGANPLPSPYVAFRKAMVIPVKSLPRTPIRGRPLGTPSLDGLAGIGKVLKNYGHDSRHPLSLEGEDWGEGEWPGSARYLASGLRPPDRLCKSHQERKPEVAHTGSSKLNHSHQITPHLATIKRHPMPPHPHSPATSRLEFPCSSRVRPSVRDRQTRYKSGPSLPQLGWPKELLLR